MLTFSKAANKLRLRSAPFLTAAFTAPGAAVCKRVLVESYPVRVKCALVYSKTSKVGVPQLPRRGGNVLCSTIVSFL